MCQGVQRAGPNAGPAAALPAHAARAPAGWVRGRARLFTQEGKAPPQPGGDRRPTTAPRGCAWSGARSSKAPTGPNPGSSPTWGCSEGAFHPQTPPPAQAPRRRLRAATCATKFLSAQRAARLTWEPGHERAKPEEAGVQGRRGPRHGGAPDLSGGARDGLCGNVRPRLERGERGRGAAASSPARSRGSRRPGSGGRRWRLLWPAPGHHHPSHSARSQVLGPPLPDRRPGRSGCRRSGPPRRAALRRGRAGSQLPLQLGLRDAPRAESPPRAGTLNTSPAPPPLPFLRPARQAPLSSLFSPPLLSPFPGPRPAATRSVYGGAERAPSWASSAPRRDPPGTRGPGRPGGSPFRRAWGGGSKSLDRIWLDSRSSWALRKGGGALLTQRAEITSGG